MDMLTLSKGAFTRLERIKQLKKCDDETALEFAINAGWLAAESLDTNRRLERIRRELLDNHAMGTCGGTCLFCQEKLREEQENKSGTRNDGTS